MSMMLLVERLVIGSGAGPSASFLTSLPVSGVSATDDSSAEKALKPSNVEPGCDPDVFDREDQAQNQLDREQPQHRDGEELEGQVLKQARPIQKLLLEPARRRQPGLEAFEGGEVRAFGRGPRHQEMEEQPADEED